MTSVAALFRRPQPVTVSMVALFAIIPLYLVIGHVVAGGTVHRPEIALDRAIPVRAEWSLVYGSLLCAAFLPAFVIHQPALVQRTIRAFLAAWLTAYAFFVLYPTIGPRPEAVEAGGFTGWALRVIYSSDVRYNCLPSLHVAQCFLAALACSRVHAGVGAIALAWAALVAISTLFTKQHYVLDVIGGIALAGAAYAVFLRGYPRAAVPQAERDLAPRLAAMAFATYGLIVAGLWVIYAFGS